MKNARRGTSAVRLEPVGTYDFASPVAMVRAIDLAMRRYFNADNWMALRDQLFPRLRRQI
jgi:hypothetical protein